MPPLPNVGDRSDGSVGRFCSQNPTGKAFRSDGSVGRFCSQNPTGKALRSGARASFSVDFTARGDGAFIDRAKAKLGAERTNDNRLWVEGLMMHLDRPMPANVTLPPDHPLADRSPQLLIRSADAIDNLDSMLLQPIDMRWDASGHEREKMGLTNGIRGAVVLSEVRNVNELWVVFVFWMKEFPEEAVFLAEHLGDLGMSVDVGATDVLVSDEHPDTAVFVGPQFYGGAVLFRQIAADRDSRIGALAENAVDHVDTSREERTMDLEKILAVVQATNKESADVLRELLKAKDAEIAGLHVRLGEAAASAQAIDVDAVRAETRAAVEAAGAAAEAQRVEAEKASALAEQVTSLKAMVDELKNAITTLTAQRDEAMVEVQRRDDETRLMALMSARIAKLSEVMPVTDDEMTDEWKATVAQASDDRFEVLLVQRELAKVRQGASGAGSQGSESGAHQDDAGNAQEARPGDASTSRTGASAHAAWKGGDASKDTDLVSLFADRLSDLKLR